MTTVIEATGLIKTFGSTRALDGLDLQVEQGEVHGFLGPNGSGKTTTIRILLGLLKADAGSARLLGVDPWVDTHVRSRIAYVPGDVSLWPNLTGGEVIDLLGNLRGDLDRGRKADLLERFDLDPTKKCRSYSKGNRQKVALVAALASHAELFLLDEPTAGLDPLMESVFAQYTRVLTDGGATLLLSSHILSEVEALSDRISIIRAGRIVETATLEQMRQRHTTSVRAEVQRPVAGLEHLSGVSDLRHDDHQVRFTVDAEHLDEAIALVSAAGVTSLVSEPPSLEQLFLGLYGGPGMPPASEATESGRHAGAPR